MRTFVCTNFEGAWPVGTSAVILARDPAHAEELLRAKLVERFGEATFYDDRPDIWELSAVADEHEGIAEILNDGEY